MSIKVRALQTGYYGGRQRKGAVFTISGKTDKDGRVLAFSPRWMVDVDGVLDKDGKLKPAPKADAKKDAKPAPKADAKAGDGDQPPPPPTGG